MQSDFFGTILGKNSTHQQPEISPYYNRITKYHKRMDGSIPAGATLFIGDSVTQGLATSAIADVSVNFGIGSDTTLGVIKRLPFYKSIDRAKAVVIAIGVNDLKYRDNNSIVQNYQKILNYLPVDMPVVVSAILPVDERVESMPLTNERIIKLNAAIKALARNYKNVVFVDARDLLQGDAGSLKKAFHTGDGVHLSAAGYQVWISLLRNALSNT
ncbi:GDSL-type esterase/lipase family protein [Oceanicoccus sp. KOV_DT_Chl]|uniref:GDSL-type esterase/lipase family protein n=1 Tax=Oceanicoccus sp. KOV_DT_Chl TaxID=1904639 RepID=UPI001358E359|nr:GDSL-type esterase/lipase family protein [Oceanicoccus sp. KOV_DT_Chl]